MQRQIEVKMRKETELISANERLKRELHTSEKLQIQIEDQYKEQCVALRLEILTSAQKAMEVLSNQEMRTEDLHQRAHLLRNRIKELEHILALTKTELAEEKAEKIKYIGLYEDKCKQYDVQTEVLSKRNQEIANLKDQLAERDRRIDELLLEVEQLKTRIRELE